MKEETTIITKLKNTAAWLVFLLLGASVGMSLIGGALVIPLVPSMTEIVIGWVIILLTALATLMALIDTTRE